MGIKIANDPFEKMNNKQVFQKKLPDTRTFCFIYIVESNPDRFMWQYNLIYTRHELTYRLIRQLKYKVRDVIKTLYWKLNEEKNNKNISCEKLNDAKKTQLILHLGLLFVSRSLAWSSSWRRSFQDWPGPREDADRASFHVQGSGQRSYCSPQCTSHKYPKIVAV